jgi:hypothetical protein
MFVRADYFAGGVNAGESSNPRSAVLKRARKDRGNHARN